MTEAEILELVAMYAEGAMTAYSIYLTITFAYMTVAYFVGDKLSHFQVAAASGLYLVGSLTGLLSAYVHVHAWSTLKSEFPGGLSALDSSIWWNGEFWKVLIAASLFFGILVSLYFMYNVRHTAESLEST
jgi:hypothetical protein